MVSGPVAAWVVWEATTVVPVLLTRVMPADEEAEDELQSEETTSADQVRTSSRNASKRGYLRGGNGRRRRRGG